MELANQSSQQFMLSTETFNKVTEIVKELVIGTQSDFALFCDSNGNPITHYGKNATMDLSGLSALIAGNFAATREMAKFIGEKNGFKFIFQEGEHKNFYLCDAGFDFLVTIIFQKNVKLGLIRIRANKTIGKLKEVLQNAVETEDQTSEILDEEFSMLLGEELDKSFN